jgi:hypothetical protein
VRSIAELSAVAELGELELNIAHNEIDSMTVELKGRGAAGPVMTPKDEINARIQERQKHLELLDARFQLQKAEVSLLRQSGGIEKWLQSLPRSSSVTP